ncbi:MAG: hypothetical protein ACK5OB_21470 [Pirellula sp.]
MGERRDDLEDGAADGDGLNRSGVDGVDRVVDGGGKPPEPTTNPYADGANPLGPGVGVGVSQSDNPFEPSASPGLSAALNAQLGMGYWGPMIGLFVALLASGMVGGFASILFFGCMYVIALFHGVVYQSRLFARAGVGELNRRLPDGVVFLVSCLVGFLSPVAAGVAFLSVCAVSNSAAQGANAGPGYEMFFVFSFALAAVAAVTLGVVLFRLFLPRKPK